MTVSASKSGIAQSRRAGPLAERSASTLLIVSVSVLGIALAYFAVLYWITY